LETENLTAARGRIERQLRPLMPDYDERQDVVQECLVKVWKRHCTYRGDSELTTWLHAVVRNEFLTWVRRARRRYVVEEQAAPRTFSDGSCAVRARPGAGRANPEGAEPHQPDHPPHALPRWAHLRGDRSRDRTLAGDHPV
jgi:RNA polymerase sigma factor (sigma-70 family)